MVVCSLSIVVQTGGPSGAECHHRLWGRGATIPGSLTSGQSTTRLVPCGAHIHLMMKCASVSSQVPAAWCLWPHWWCDVSQLVHRAHPLFCLRDVSCCEWPQKSFAHVTHTRSRFVWDALGGAEGQLDQPRFQGRADVASAGHSTWRQSGPTDHLPVSAISLNSFSHNRVVGL